MVNSEFAPSGAKVLGGTVGGAVLGFAVAGPSGAIAGGFLGLVLGVTASGKGKIS